MWNVHGRPARAIGNLIPFHPIERHPQIVGAQIEIDIVIFARARGELELVLLDALPLACMRALPESVLEFVGLEVGLAFLHEARRSELSWRRQRAIA